MLACEWYRMRKACGTLLSGYGTELTLVHDALQQREGISQTVHFRSPAFFFHMVNSFLTQLIRSGIPTHRIALTVSAMRHSPKFVGRTRTRSA
jgi:hypothetical protein